MGSDREKVKINHDYFSLNSKWENLISFLSQGHVFSHLIDRAKWHYFPKHFITPAFPTHLEIEASSTCQMRCPMCKSTQMLQSGVRFQGVMKMDLYKKIIDECMHEPLYSIKLSWRGEPLLNPNIIEMVAYAKEKVIKDVAFLSNGERLNEENIKGLVKAGLDWISVSFDGMGEVYNKIRKPAIYEETYEKLRFFRKYREGLGRKRPLIRVQSVHSAIRGKEEEYLQLWDGVADRVNFIADQKRSIEQKDYRHDPHYICPSPWQRMCIAWDGRVAQCYGDYMMDNVLGDAGKDTIKKIWTDKPFVELRELMKKGKRLSTKPCRTCSDGGVTEEEEVVVGSRKIKAAHYTHQGIDVKELPKAKQNDGKL